MLFRSLTSLFITLGFLFPFAFAQAQDSEWELRKDKNGIKVYVKQLEASSFDAFRVNMEVEATMKELDYMLHHLNEYKSIFPDTREIKILERGEDWLIQYSMNDAPWPADDRDGIYKMHFYYDDETGGLHTKGTAIPDYIPRKESVVRITNSLAYWRVTPMRGNKVHIEYEVHAEPGGSIPDWIVNSAITEVPYSTFMNLRDTLTGD